MTGDDLFDAALETHRQGQSDAALVGRQQKQRDAALEGTQLEQSEPTGTSRSGGSHEDFSGRSGLIPPKSVQAAPTAVGPAASPLAVRMRPRTLDELVGQTHLAAPGAPLTRLVEGDAPLSVILHGPPGTGKTTIARIVSGATNRRFAQLSALDAGVKEVRAEIEAARQALATSGRHTVLFIDEVHRFSKTQQDSLLSAVEDRLVALIAATTENPFFSIVAPLLSRSLLLTLEPLDDEAIRTVIRRAVIDERGLANTVTLASEAEDHLVRLAVGDARKALTALEAAAGSAHAQNLDEISLSLMEQAVSVAALRYDRDGDAHYDIVSAFIKSIRGSDPDAALHYLARMLVAGEDPRFITRRLVILASEDIGMADSNALQVAMAADDAVQFIGLPEGKIILAHAVIYLATAPKSNAVITAINAAESDVRSGKGGSVPTHLRDAHYKGAQSLGHGEGYSYPHSDPAGVSAQQYPPDDLVDREYYNPSRHGAERDVAERLTKLRNIVRGGRTT